MVKKNILFAAMVVLAVLSFVGAAWAQSGERKPRGPGRGRGGPNIMPEFAPPEGQQKFAGPKFLVDITTHEVKNTPAGWTFTVKGTSEFPDDTEASVTIRFFEEMLVGMPVFIRNGLFEASFESNEYWSGKRFFPGNYELEVEIRYKRQSPSQKDRIVAHLGKQGKTRAYRNKYVVLGDEKTRKREEKKLKDYYVRAITEVNKLFNELGEKARAAGEKFLTKFAVRDDKDKRKPKRDPKNNYAYLVDNKKWKDYLAGNPNEFFTKTGVFKKSLWRKWLDKDWRRSRWEKLYKEHNRMLGDYVALPWPREYNDMKSLLKIIIAMSAKNSIDIYRWNGLPVHKNDTNLTAGGESLEGVRIIPSKRETMIRVESLKQKLKLVQHIREKQAAEEKKKGKEGKKKCTVCRKASGRKSYQGMCSKCWRKSKRKKGR